MKYNFCRYTLYVMLLCNNIIYSISIKSKFGNVDIDDFLNKVIISKKFDELADKIAERAVEKLQNLPNFVTSTNKVGHRDVVYRVSERDIEQPNEEEKAVNIPHKNTTEEAEKVTKATRKGVLGKIDSEAFKRKESRSKKDLSLKYKYFTKSIHHQPSHEEGEVKLTDLENTTSFAQSQEERSKETFNFGEPAKDLDGIRKRVKNKVNNIKRDKLPTTSSVEGIASKEKAHDDSNCDSEHSGNDDDHKISKENTQFKEQVESKEMKWEEGSELDSSNKEINKNKNSKDNSVSRKPNYESNDNKTDVRKFRSKPKSFQKPYKVDGSSSENKGFIKSNETEKDDEPAFYKRSDMFMIRREGNKLYTHEKSPDYKDYHDEIERIRKFFKRKSNH